MKRGKSFTEREELLENVRIVKSLLEEERYWASERAAGFIVKQRGIITDAKVKIQEAEARIHEAPSKVLGLQATVIRMTKQVTTYDNRAKIKAVASLEQQISDLRAELDAERD